MGLLCLFVYGCLCVFYVHVCLCVFYVYSLKNQPFSAVIVIRNINGVYTIFLIDFEVIWIENKMIFLSKNKDISL